MPFGPLRRLGRHNPVNAYTMGGLVIDAGLTIARSEGEGPMLPGGNLTLASERAHAGRSRACRKVKRTD